MSADTVSAATAPAIAAPAWVPGLLKPLEDELAVTHGEGQRARARRGLQQVSRLWQADDGDKSAFQEFVRLHFVGEPAALDEMFHRLQALLEQLDGHTHEISRSFREHVDLDRGPVAPYDQILAGYDPASHVVDDFFRNKLAFAVLLNFPLTTLDERLTDGPRWSRRQWADTRLPERFATRIPGDVNQGIAQAAAEAGRYIAQYNIWMHHLLDGSGRRLFPPKLRLLSHWNLRDEIKASYGDPVSGLSKQRLIQRVMDRIVTQTIPQSVIDNPHVDWNPFSNEVRPAASRDADDAPAGRDAASSVPEPSTRYAMLLKTFRAARRADPYSPTAPTLMARRFDEEGQIPEARVQAMLEEILTSPLVPRVAQVIRQRVGRPLEAFDLWYSGFRPGATHAEPELDRLVTARYPSASAFEQDMPRLLTRLAFAPQRARELAGNIVVEPARGSGHALGAGMRSERVRLRTRIEAAGMNYKGFHIAVHEMGHNVEQTLSLRDIDFTLLRGVPNVAFTEALAFVFQGHDLELLGLRADDKAEDALSALNELWGAYEVAGVALVDMAVWRWMYAHPDASPEQLRDATVRIAKDMWNRYYAPVFGQRDAVLLGIYSHLVDSFLYLPDYPIGRVIAFQVEAQMRKAGGIGPEFERMAKIGAVTPDLWMTHATGRPVGTGALLDAARNALDQLPAH